MPRRIAQLHRAFAHHASEAVSLARAGEVARDASARGTVVWKEMRLSRLEALYEMAYLRVFVAWELFLEDSFLRCMCGHRTRRRRARPAAGTLYHPTIAMAETALYGSFDYLLWHDPVKVSARCRRHLISSTHEVILLSHQARLLHFANIRHRIAHGQEDAQNKFDNATMNLAHKHYRASRPGRFLRDWNTSVTPNIRWLDYIKFELLNLANQII